MKKKIFGALMAILLLFSLTSCKKTKMEAFGRKQLDNGVLYMATFMEKKQSIAKGFTFGVNYARSADFVITEDYYVYCWTAEKKATCLFPCVEELKTSDEYIVRFEDKVNYNGEENSYRFYFGFNNDYKNTTLTNVSDIFPAESGCIYFFLAPAGTTAEEAMDLSPYCRVTMDYEVTEKNILLS